MSCYDTLHDTEPQKWDTVNGGRKVNCACHFVKWKKNGTLCVSCCDMRIAAHCCVTCWDQDIALHYRGCVATHCMALCHGNRGEALGWGHGMGGFVILCDSKPRISVVARCNMLQLAAICYGTLHHTEAHCNTLLGDLCDTATHCHTLLWDVLRRLQWEASQRVLQCVAGCCRVLRCGVLQCVAACCSVLQCSEYRAQLMFVRLECDLLQCVAVCCSVLQCVAVWCSVVQCGAVWVSTKLNFLFWWCDSLSWVLSASRIWLISASTEGDSCQRSTEGDSCGANRASSKATRLFLVT